MLPAKAQEVLNREDVVRDLAERLALAEHVFYIGRGLDYAAAMEGSLKLKEISYVHSEALAAGELKHGTLALITEGTPVFALATQRHVYEKMLSNIQEAKARGGSVVALTTPGDDKLASLFDAERDFIITLPEAPPLLMPLLAVVPLQLLAYDIAVRRGCDVDQPRNLAKSVTVE